MFDEEKIGVGFMYFRKMCARESFEQDECDGTNISRREKKKPVLKMFAWERKEEEGKKLLNFMTCKFQHRSGASYDETCEAKWP